LHYRAFLDWDGSKTRPNASFVLLDLLLVDVFLRLQLFHQRLEKNLLIVGSARHCDFDFLQRIVIVSLGRIEPCCAVVDDPIVGIFLCCLTEKIEGLILFALGLKLSAVILHLRGRGPLKSGIFR
jgi:hypothetical protein